MTRFTSHYFASLALVLSIGLSCAAVADVKTRFDPTAYVQHTANCPGINHVTNNSVPVQLKYVDINPSAKQTLLLVHGWPSLWSLWREQILEYGDSYRLIVPTLRGFGASTHPASVQTSGGVIDAVADLQCILAQAGAIPGNVICVGHDWGAAICYESGRERPDIFKGVVGVSIPYSPATGSNYTEVDAFLPIFPHFGYQLYFQNDTSTAIGELNKDIARTLLSTYRTVSSPPPASFLVSTTDFLGAFGNSSIPPSPFLSEHEMDYVVEQYEIQKFDKNLEFYTHANRVEAFNYASKQGNLTLTQPVLSFYPTQDIVGNWSELAQLANSSGFINDLTVRLIETAHWPQLEQPEWFNGNLTQWLKTNFKHT